MPRGIDCMHSIGFVREVRKKGDSDEEEAFFVMPPSNLDSMEALKRVLKVLEHAVDTAAKIETSAAYAD